MSVFHVADRVKKTYRLYMDKIFVADLSEKQTVQSLFLVKEKNLQMGKNGRSYLSLFISDRTGSMDARAWDNVEDMDRLFQSGDIIRVKGQVQVFQGRRQFIIHKVERADKSDYNPEHFIAESQLDPEDLLRQLLLIVESIHDSFIRQLAQSVLQDPSIRERILVAPAAKTIHHAKVGGLLEHIVSICRVMEFMALHYKQLNRDLLIFGAIFHDIGKIWELSTHDGIQYTDEGRLIGHLVMSVELIERKAQKIFGFPEPLKMILKHIVLSHHNLLEYGSPKRPKFLEALVVAMIDDLDSKIDTLTSIQSEAETWTRYSPMFDRYFYTKAHDHVQIPEESLASPQKVSKINTDSSGES